MTPPAHYKLCRCRVNSLRLCEHVLLLHEDVLRGGATLVPEPEHLGALPGTGRQLPASRVLLEPVLALSLRLQNRVPFLGT